jgi:inorganic pyrophosphatase
MHPWHDIPVDEGLIDVAFPVVIEELDKQTGVLRLDRVLYSAVHYPANRRLRLGEDGRNPRARRQ